MRLMLDEVARILAAYQELRDSRLNDVLEVSNKWGEAYGYSTLFASFFFIPLVCVFLRAEVME